MGDHPKPKNLQSPYETSAWLTLKDGYLHKTKLAKGLIPSTKLRWFALKQNPNTFESRLEYYEGRTCKGWLSLRDAEILPSDKIGCFTVISHHRHESSTVARSMKLQAEAHDPQRGAGWVLALQSAAKVFRENAKARQEQSQEEKANSQSKIPQELLARLDDDEGSVAQRANRAGVELDGDAIDRARWNALHRRSRGVSTGEVELEEDEDVKLLRQMEEEEERRQEEERLAFLAEREARVQRQQSVKRLQETELEEDGVMSEGDEWDPEEEMRLLREAEEEEERRQEEERLLWQQQQQYRQVP